MKQFIGHYFYKEIQRYNDKLAVEVNGKGMTYKELFEFSVGVAKYLDELQIDGNCALFLSNSLEYVIADVGIMFGGNTRVSINTMVGKKELTYILKDAEIEAVFVDSATKARIIELNLDLKIIDVTECKQLDKSINAEIPIYKRKPYRTTAPAIIAYTGGTTGQPKGAVYTHEKLLLVLLSHITEIRLTEDEKLLLVSPFAHSAGMILLAGLLKGATIIAEKKFQPKKVLSIIENKSITFTFMVPTMIYRLLDTLEANPTFHVSSIKTILYGASPIYESRLKQALKLFGPVFTQLYGQTESYNFITRLTKKDHHEGLVRNNGKLKSCGRPVLLSSVKIVNDDGEELAPHDLVRSLFPVLII